MLAVASAILLASSVAGDPEAASRGKTFWKALAAECVVPEGESVAGLVAEAVSFLGSRDSEWRDDVGYGVVARCVYRERALSHAERRTVVDRLSRNLRYRIGETGTDSVLLRSFSALDLSVFAALENEEPALGEADFRKLLAVALAYLRDERDLRGFEPGVGWIHATAHTADLLKFLGRDHRLGPRDQDRLLDAVWVRMTAPGTAVFTHGEDERLAAAVASVVRRTDLDEELLDRWLDRFTTLEKQVWAGTPPDPVLLDASQNARNLLRSLYVGLCLAPPAARDAAHQPPAHEASAREKVLATLERIRR